MTEEMINKDELKKIRVLLESGQKLAISTKEFERVFDEIDRLEQENKELIEDNLNLSKENRELEKQHYETLKMLKHEYDSRRKDNEQWFTRCTENHNEDSKIIEKYRSALEEIRDIAKFNQFYNPEDLLINGDIGQIQDLKMTEIYKKCNEVLNEN